MPLKRKEKQQIIVLGVLLAVILGAVAYYYRGSLLPQPSGGAQTYTPPPRVELPTIKTATDLFQRTDYKTLRQFGSIPVKAVSTGPNNPFE